MTGSEERSWPCSLIRSLAGPRQPDPETSRTENFSPRNHLVSPARWVIVVVVVVVVVGLPLAARRRIVGRSRPRGPPNREVSKMAGERFRGDGWERGPEGASAFSDVALWTLRCTCKCIVNTCSSERGSSIVTVTRWSSSRVSSIKFFF